MNKKPYKLVFVRNGTCTCGYAGGLYVPYISSNKTMRCALCCEQERHSDNIPPPRQASNTSPLQPRL